MKPKNFPRRKLLRQMEAKGLDINSEESRTQLLLARGVRTKKDRSK